MICEAAQMRIAVCVNFFEKGEDDLQMSKQRRFLCLKALQVLTLYFLLYRSLINFYCVFCCFKNNN